MKKIFFSILLVLCKTCIVEAMMADGELVGAIKVAKSSYSAVVSKVAQQEQNITSLEYRTAVQHIVGIMGKIKTELNKKQKLPMDGDIEQPSDSPLICSYDLFFGRLWELSEQGEIGKVLSKKLSSSDWQQCLSYFNTTVSELIPLDDQIQSLIK
jgi:hypothetical protein